MPKCAASNAPSPLEPRIQSGGAVGPAGIARTPVKGWPGGSSSWRKLMRSASCWGNCSSPSAPGPCRSSRAVRWSLPGARPMPRSMRPGNSASSTRKFSATLRAL